MTPDFLPPAKVTQGLLRYTLTSFLHLCRLSAVPARPLEKQEGTGWRSLLPLTQCFLSGADGGFLGWVSRAVDGPPSWLAAGRGRRAKTLAIPLQPPFTYALRSLFSASPLLQVGGLNIHLSGPEPEALCSQLLPLGRGAVSIGVADSRWAALHRIPHPPWTWDVSEKLRVQPVSKRAERKTFLVPMSLSSSRYFSSHQSEAQSSAPQHSEMHSAVKKFHPFLATCSVSHDVAASSDDLRGRVREHFIRPHLSNLSEPGEAAGPKISFAFCTQHPMTGNTLVTTYLLPQNLALGFPLGARENVGLQLAWRAETIFFTSSSQHWWGLHWYSSRTAMMNTGMKRSFPQRQCPGFSLDLACTVPSHLSRLEFHSRRADSSPLLLCVSSLWQREEGGQSSFILLSPRKGWCMKGSIQRDRLREEKEFKLDLRTKGRTEQSELRLLVPSSSSTVTDCGIIELSREGRPRIKRLGFWPLVGAKGASAPTLGLGPVIDTHQWPQLWLGGCRPQASALDDPEDSQQGHRTRSLLCPHRATFQLRDPGPEKQLHSEPGYLSSSTGSQLLPLLGPSTTGRGQGGQEDSASAKPRRQPGELQLTQILTLPLAPPLLPIGPDNWVPHASWLPPHLSLASLPILPQGPSQGRISKPKKAQPYGKIEVENTVDQEFRQRSCTRTCFSDLDGGEDRRGGPARQPHTLTTPGQDEPARAVGVGLGFVNQHCLGELRIHSKAGLPPQTN
ncbi:hypothetical protein Cadr_000019033 [Camelus dromedarius]|uniref:Uncharacterized protein n=1 Tax=Camelus dromedarius TaxID=9838 RepID=A0A5N4D691_CAMDR|nr:hypothetical protein Cadr_000019033 [Camelus dromedarius]